MITHLYVSCGTHTPNNYDISDSINNAVRNEQQHSCRHTPGIRTSNAGSTDFRVLMFKICIAVAA